MSFSWDYLGTLQEREEATEGKFLVLFVCFGFFSGFFDLFGLVFCCFGFFLVCFFFFLIWKPVVEMLRTLHLPCLQQGILEVKQARLLENTRQE